MTDKPHASETSQGQSKPFGTGRFTEDGKFIKLPLGNEGTLYVAKGSELAEQSIEKVNRLANQLDTLRK